MQTPQSEWSDAEERDEWEAVVSFYCMDPFQIVQICNSINVVHLPCLVRPAKLPKANSCWMDSVVCFVSICSKKFIFGFCVNLLLRKKWLEFIIMLCVVSESHSINWFTGIQFCARRRLMRFIYLWAHSVWYCWY